MTIVGTLYDDGRGVTQDYGEAMRWYLRAAEKGDAVAMNYIGDIFENGHGVAKDIGAAVKWFRRAAALGNGVAQQNLKRLGQ